MEKNQAAIDQGRYEIENRRFYHPNEYRQDGQQQHEPRMTPNDLGSSWSVSGGAEAGRQSSKGRLGNLFNKATGRLSTAGQVEERPEPAAIPERARLRKRSSSRMSASKLSIVGE